MESPPSLDPAEYRLGVHGSHCCIRHGCKYGDADCPVHTGETVQQYPCEYCEEDPISPQVVDTVYEYGVGIRDRVHRSGYTEAEAYEWINEWEEGGGKIGVFYVIRRPVANWTRA